MSTVLLLLDAFRHDYLDSDNTPFLWECANSGELYRGVEQSFGFCERSEIVSGQTADETGFFTAVGFDPENSPYADSSFLSLFQLGEALALRLIRWFLPERLGSRVHKRLRLYATRYFRKNGVATPNFQIPFSWLKYFALTEDRVDLRQKGLFSRPSIFELLETNNISYLYDTFTALGLTTKYQSDWQRLDAVVEAANSDPADAYFIYIAAPDSQGHMYGPTSPEVRENMQILDRKLKEFVDSLEAVSPGNDYIFLGDHGMLSVEQKFDADAAITELLRSNELSKGSDVLYFLDSTMVRLWAMSDAANNTLETVLNGATEFQEYGHWMTPEEAMQLRIPWPDPRYGEHLWVANPGVIVFPDFFRRVEPAKGMHGYAPDLKDSLGVCVFWGPGAKTENSELMPLSGVYELLKRSQGI